MMWLWTKRKKSALPIPLKEYISRIEDLMMLQVPRKAELERYKERHPWRCLSAIQEGKSIRIQFETPAGLSYLDLEKQVDAISATCAAPAEVINEFGATTLILYPFELLILITLAEAMQHIDKEKGYLMGLDQAENPVYLTFYEPHLMAAGTSGFGKTAWVMLFLFQLLTLHDPRECRIQIIDLKGTEFWWAASYPHMLPIVDSIVGARDTLKKAHGMMKQRQKAVKEAEKEGESEPYFPEFYLIIDEAANLAPSQQPNDDLKDLAKECDSYISEITRIGRSLKMHLIYCTQYPMSNVMNPQIKANVTQRIVFRLPDQVQSLVALDEPGAEDLQVKGRAIFKESKGKTILQVPFASKQEYRQFLHLHQFFDSYREDEGTHEVGNQADDLGGYDDPPSGGHGTDSPFLSTEQPPEQTGLRVLKGIGAGKVGERPKKT